MEGEMALKEDKNKVNKYGGTNFVGGGTNFGERCWLFWG
jgi:hypothetical protein